MAQNYQKLAVSKETYLMITKECVDEFIKNNPEVIKLGVRVTHEMIVSRIAKYYLGRT